MMQKPTRPVTRLSPNGGDPLDELIDRAIEQRVFTGISCGVWVDGHPKFSRYAGYTADPLDSAAAEPEPVTERTLFDSASLTKPLATTLLVMKAVEASLIDIGETIGYYLPDAGSRTAGIPIRTLLTHTSGMPAIPALERHFPTSAKLDREAAIAGLLAIQPDHRPGEHVCYSCTGYMLLGLILERTSGMLIGDLYRKEIAEPLRLPSATFAPGIGSVGEPIPIIGTAATEFCAWRNRRMRGQVHDESAYCLGGQAGNAGLFASLDDLSIMGSMLLQKGSVNGVRFLEEASVADIMEEKTDGLEERRSFGFRLHEAGTFEGPMWGSSTLGHTGFTGTSIFIDPDRGLLSIVLANRVYYGRNETAQKMADFRTTFHTQVFKNYC